MNRPLKSLAKWIAVFAAVYVAVLPMADTIALRNLSLLALLCGVALRFSDIRQQAGLGLMVALWALYLLLFPFIASDHQVAWSSFTGQWGMGLLAMAAGAGAGVVLLGRLGGQVFFMGIVSAVSLLIHLVLFAWKALDTGTIPWGYWGRETHHADLGYAAGHVVILMTVSALTSCARQRAWSVAFIAVALLSTLLAQSRAGLVFALLGGGLVLGVTYGLRASLLKRHATTVAIAVLGVAALLAFAAKEDPRWRSMSDQLAVGWLGDPIQIECQGTSVVAANIAAAYGHGPYATQLVESLQNRDGSRMVVLRAGIELVLKNPWGSDGSRQAFQKLLSKECIHPAILMAHAHNGWLDTMLAIGMLGASLYLGVLLSYARNGYRLLKKNDVDNEWALVLFALSVFWIVRGFTDSVYRDHMLEMQGFLLAFALVASKRSKCPERFQRNFVCVDQVDKILE